jgi:RNA recognition motif-containing protein
MSSPQEAGSSPIQAEEEDSHPAEPRPLFVGNLDPRTTTDDIYNLFEQVGEKVLKAGEYFLF